MQTASRQIGEMAVVDVQGRITVGEGNIVLREAVTSVGPLRLAMTCVRFLPFRRNSRP